MGWGKLQTALDIIYPPRCVACGGYVESDYGLCGTCWRQVHFMRGTGCWTCGLSLPGYLYASEPGLSTAQYVGGASALTLDTSFPVAL